MFILLESATELSFVLVCQTSDEGSSEISANVTIRVRSRFHPQDYTHHGDHSCLSGAPSHLRVLENLANVRIATFASVMKFTNQDIVISTGCSTNMSGVFACICEITFCFGVPFQGHDSAKDFLGLFMLLMFCWFTDYLMLDNFTAELKLLRPFDRESQRPNPVPLRVTCLVKNTTSDLSHQCSYTVRITVLDVDDNPPYLLKDNKRVQHISGFTIGPNVEVNFFNTVWAKNVNKVPIVIDVAAKNLDLTFYIFELCLGFQQWSYFQCCLRQAPLTNSLHGNYQQIQSHATSDRHFWPFVTRVLWLLFPSPLFNLSNPDW